MKRFDALTTHFGAHRIFDVTCQISNSLTSCDRHEWVTAASWPSVLSAASRGPGSKFEMMLRTNTLNDCEWNKVIKHWLIN